MKKVCKYPKCEHYNQIRPTRGEHLPLLECLFCKNLIRKNYYNKSYYTK